MKKLLLLVLLSGPGLLRAQMPDSLVACLDTAITYARQFAIKRNHVNWDPLRDTLLSLVPDAQTPMDMRPAFRYLLGALHDTHGRFFIDGKPIAWYHGQPEPWQKNIDPKLWSVIQGGKYRFFSDMLPDETGYLRIVGMPMGDNNRLAEPIRDAICSLQTQGARRWIVDLRYNGGGNMHPMLAGLAALLGEGEIGGSMDGDGNRFSTWTITDGDVLYNDFKSADMENKCPLNGTPKLAVLISRYTVSSGEVVAAAFKGRPDTRFFGEHTAGFTTETSWKILPAGVTMSVGASHYADRQGRVYLKYIPADEEIEFVPDAPPAEDPILQRALEWLRKK